MLYHASQIPGLTVLKPQISTHAKPYVYAIRSRLIALLFGAPKDDFDLLIDETDGKAVLYECYPHAVETIYAGKSCRLYTVGEDGFQQGVTGWDAELVNPNPVPVTGEEAIEDIYRQILDAVAEESCQIHFYEESEGYLAFLREELQERVDTFGIDRAYRGRDPRFIQYHNALLDDKAEGTRR